ncbi:uncharacterized protein LOC141844824 [Curcuma longa]|uniref:uncharacterized protein LOC141844824 n=1 Tax=Curcuma longa TaxID=136217 RepID=UPI003D9F06AE
MEVEDDKDMSSLNEHEVQGPQKLQRGSPESPLLPPKKQVRRRLHTTRPYQERWFNMAEARREIVAALKLHRASMKQAYEHQSMAATSTLRRRRSHELVVDSIRNSMNHPPDRTLANYFHASPFSPVSILDQLNFSLPDQPLGLNLNLQNFQNLDTSIYHSIHNPTPAEPSSSQALLSQQSSHVGEFDPSSVSLHQAIDEEEMAEIQSIGEQHDMEWNDKLNLATSAWWSKFLKNMEGGIDEDHRGANGEDAKESSLFQQHLDDYFHVDDYLQDATLELLEIEYRGE